MDPYFAFINTILKFSIYTIVICVGTFALALAFAGNDFVNFIGVPLLAINLYMGWFRIRTWQLYNGNIVEKVAAPTEILLGAGAIMIVTLGHQVKQNCVLKPQLIYQIKKKLSKDLSQISLLDF